MPLATAGRLKPGLQHRGLHRHGIIRQRATGDPPVKRQRPVKRDKDADRNQREEILDAVTKAGNARCVEDYGRKRNRTDDCRCAIFGRAERP